MLNGLLYLSSDCQNEKPFGKNVNVSGTFAVILKSALNEIEKAEKVNFSVNKKGQWNDELFVIFKGNKIKVCTIDGYSSVNKIRQAIEKKIKKGA